MTNFLKMKIGPAIRPAIVESIERTTFKRPDPERQSEKIEFTVIDQADHKFKISDAWTYHSKHGTAPRGLWFPTFINTSGQTAISPTSALAHVMKYYKVSSLEELIGKEILLYPDKEDYLLIVACNMEEYEK